MWGFTFRSVTEDNIQVPEGGDAKEIAGYCICIKTVLLNCSILWATIGMFFAVIYLIQMISFVDVRGPGQGHVSVPTVCVLIQCLMLAGSLCMGFLSKWLYVQAEVLDEDHIQ